MIYIQEDIVSRGRPNHDRFHSAEKCSVDWLILLGIEMNSM
jgi:hypothetical protein